MQIAEWKGKIHLKSRSKLKMAMIPTQFRLSLITASKQTDKMF